VARIVSTNTSPHLSALIADGTVRAPEGPCYLPAKPAKLRGTGKSAAESARKHSLRAYDAVHLAGALSFATGEELDFACWDEELRQAAQKQALSVIPKHL
jgi:hypothetical protein